MKLQCLGALFIVSERCLVHTLCTAMYGLPLSQLDPRNLSVFQSAYNDCCYSLDYEQFR